MCLIIQKTAGQQLEPEFINDVFKNNPHGWGVFHHEGGILQIEKGMSLEDFYVSYRQRWQDRAATIHFRFATHGETSLEMAHPFHVHGDIWLMHNGILSGKDYQCPDKKKSDTALFSELVRDILKLTVNPNEFIRSDKFYQLIAPEIGSNSIVLADNQGIVPMKNALSYQTTDGLLVSNGYAYSVNNPDDWRSWRDSYEPNLYGSNGRNYGYGYDNPISRDYGNQKPVWWEVDEFIDAVEFMTYEDIVDAIEEEPYLAADVILSLHEQLGRLRKPLKKRKA
jgi:hypothetical protein